MLTLKTKQQKAIDALSDPRVDTLVLLGSVGTGKTDVAAHIVISICTKFQGTVWPVFRKNISTAKKTIIPSYLSMLERSNFVEGEDYKYNNLDHFIQFPNKSIIQFTEADETKDRDGKKIKGMNSSGNHVDEADELAYSMFLQATSRRGRKNGNGQPSISIVTMNPNDGWAKDLYYTPWREGTLPPNIRVIEFDLNDSWQSKQDIEALKSNPPWWTQRYLYNNWEYTDESMALFKSRHWASSIVDTLDGTLDRKAGYDVARSGTDRSVRALLYGLTIADIDIFKDKLEQKDSNIQAEMLEKDAETNNYGLENMAVDAVGLGVGLVDALKGRGFTVVEYMSGAKPDENIKLTAEDDLPLNFDYLRSQMIYLYALGIEKGLIKHYSGCPFLQELRKEAMLHNFKITDKVLSVESKEQIKKRLGLSPDIFDSVIMALYLALKREPAPKVRIYF